MEHTAASPDELLNEIEQAAGVHGAAARQFASMLQRGGPGCVTGILETFRARGLGEIAASWAKGETHQSVTPAQIQSVFGAGQLVGFAGMIGVPPGEISVRLAEWLPLVIGKLAALIGDSRPRPVL